MADNVSGRRPLVCVVGAVEFITESLTADGHCQLTSYSVNTDYSDLVQSVMLEQVAATPTLLQAVDGEDCVCGIVSNQVTIWYHSRTVLHASSRTAQLLTLSSIVGLSRGLKFLKLQSCPEIVLKFEIVLKSQS